MLFSQASGLPTTVDRGTIETGVVAPGLGCSARARSLSCQWTMPQPHRGRPFQKGRSGNPGGAPRAAGRSPFRKLVAEALADARAAAIQEFRRALSRTRTVIPSLEFAARQQGDRPGLRGWRRGRRHHQLHLQRAAREAGRGAVAGPADRGDELMATGVGRDVVNTMRGGGSRDRTGCQGRRTLDCASLRHLAGSPTRGARE
jgi:hypothetical protein